MMSSVPFCNNRLRHVVVLQLFQLAEETPTQMLTKGWWRTMFLKRARYSSHSKASSSVESANHKAALKI